MSSRSNPMMNPTPFESDNNSGVPMFSKHGTLLGNEERQKIADRKGVCLTCGTKTHEVGLMRRSALTNDDVYQGTCIRCNGSSVPANILQEWQLRQQPNQQAPVQKLKTVANVVRATTLQQQSEHQRTQTQSVRRLQSYQPQPTRPASLHDLGVSNRSDHRPTMSTSSLPREQVRHHNLPARSASDTTASQVADARTRHLQHAESFHSVGSSVGGETTTPPPSFGPEDYKTSLDVDSFSLMKDIQDNREKPDVLKQRLHCFRNLADDQAGVLDEIRKVFERYGRDGGSLHNRLIVVATGSVWGICSKNDGKKQEAADSGCLDLIVETVLTNRDDPETVHWALGTVASLALLDENKSMIAKKGGLESILDALSTHQTNPTVFEWACRALYNMITPSEGSSDESLLELERNITSIEEYGGIGILISALTQHIERDPVAVWWAMKVLLRMRDHSNEGAVINSTRMMAEQGLSDLCSKIIKARSTTDDLFIAASEMLASLICFTTLSQQPCNSTDCLSAIMRFVAENKSTNEMKTSGAKLLGLIARGNNQAKSQISGHRCLRVLVETASNATDDLELVKYTIFLLCSLSCDGSSFDFSLLGQVKAMVEGVSRLHPNDHDLNSYICAFVCNNALIAEDQPESMPLAVVGKICAASDTGEHSQYSRVLRLITSKFPQYLGGQCDSGPGEAKQLLTNLCDANIDVQVSCCASLTALVSSSEETRSLIFDEGGLSTATASLMVTESEILAGHIVELISALVCSDTKKALLLPNEIISGILQGMQRFPSLTKNACIAIRNTMLVTVPGFESVDTAGLTETLCTIIDSSSTPDDILIDACGAIWAYCSKQVIPATDCPRLFASLLGLCERNKGGENTQFNSPVLTESAGALSSVMYRIRDNPIHIPESDIDSIIAILDLVIECDVDNVVLMDRLLNVVMTLCCFCKEVLIQFGVIVVVIDCMVEHEGQERIQQDGCAILAMLASTENLQVNISIAETDGVDMIVSALAGFSDNKQIQTDACRALSHLSIDHESRMLICSQGGLLLLVNAMNKYHSDVDLLEAACSALLNLSSDAEEQVLANAGVVEAVISTIQRPVASSRLQEKCLGILQNLAMKSTDAKRAVTQAGGITAVIFTMKEFMGSPSVMERSFTALWSLAVLEENQHTIADQQGIGLIVNGMMANITYEKVQKQACGCLCTLSSASRNKGLIRDYGGVDAIVYAMWAHYDSESMLVEACRALSSLAVDVTTNEVMIASEGEISAIMAGMRRFPDSERLQEHACVALRNFMLSVDNVALVQHQQDQLKELVNSAAARFPDRCGDRARQVLQCIGGG